MCRSHIFKRVWSQCEPVCDAARVWASGQEHARVLYNAVYVTVRLTLKLALGHHEIGYEILDMTLTRRLCWISGLWQPMGIKKRYPFLHNDTSPHLCSHGEFLCKVRSA